MGWDGVWCVSNFDLAYFSVTFVFVFDLFVISTSFLFGLLVMFCASGGGLWSIWGRWWVAVDVFLLMAYCQKVFKVRYQSVV